MASSIPFGPGFGLPPGSFSHSSSLDASRQQSSRSSRTQATSRTAGANAPEGTRGGFPAKASVIAGGLALTGDTIAQSMEKKRRYNKTLGPGEEGDVWGWLLGPHDFVRSLRMLTYGALLYGPGSDVWYKFLDRLLGKELAPFPVISKIVLNQIVLGPIVVGVVFAWNFLWAGRIKQLPAKYKADFVPTMVDGWKFWVPAATVNFGLVPLQGRVGFMSLCSIFWNFYLSSRMMK